MTFNLCKIFRESYGLAIKNVHVETTRGQADAECNDYQEEYRQWEKLDADILEQLVGKTGGIAICAHVDCRKNSDTISRQAL